MQCLFGADRDEPALRGCLDPYAPVLYRLLGHAADQTGVNLDRVRLCGVLPRLAGVLPVLVGLGYRRFSVDSAWIPYLAEGLRALTLADARDLAMQVRACSESREVRELLGTTVEEQRLC
jgi:phosphoenolpyruvate-protein kinase (PTS system EI component)